MKKLYRFLLFSAMLLPASVFGQTPTTIYDFSTAPITYTTSYAITQSGSDPLSLSPNIATNGGQGVAGTSAGASIATPSGLLSPANSSQSLSLYDTNSDRGYTLDLPSIPQTSANYMVQWTHWIRSNTAPRTIGLLMGGGATTSTATASGQNVAGQTGINTTDYVGIRPGYAFFAVISGNATAASASITFYLYSVTVTGGNASFTLLTTTTATGKTINGVNNGIIFRTTAQYKTLKIEYALDGTGTSWSTGVTFTNPSVSLNSGVTQMLFGTPKAGFSCYSYVDDIKYAALTIPPTAVFSGYNKYIYNGSPQGPTYSTVGFTGTPTLTTTYQGKSTSGITYSSSETAPTNPGSYVVSTSATDGVNTVTDQKAFEILSSIFDITYTFNSDVLGSAAGSTSYSGYAHKVAYLSSNQTINGTSYPITGQMLIPNNELSMTTLTNFGSAATNYSVTWKEFPTATVQKMGVILRSASGTAYNGTTLNGQGYLFYVNNTGATTAQMDIRKINASGAPTTLISNGSVTYNGINAPTWFRATVNGSSLKFEISTDGGINWTTAGLTTDASYSSGLTQVVGISSGGTSYYLDYFGYTDLTRNITGNDNKFIYTGSSLSPTISYPGFTSPTTTLTYTGTGGTSYSASTSAPAAVGTYSLAVTASESGISRAATFGFEIIPSTYDNIYTFKSDVVGSTPSNIVYPTSASANGTGVVALYPGTDNGAASTAITFQPTAIGSVGTTGVANLTAFAASSNYSVTWKEYIGAYNSKKGFLLQGQTGTCAYANDLKQGYLFIVLNDATVGTILRIYKTDAAGVGYPVVNANNTIANPAIGSARWYRATVAYGVQKFEYSDNGTTWVTGLTWNDVTYAGLSGTTQAVYGLNAGVGTYYYDYIAANAWTSVFNKNGSSNWSTATEWTKAPTSTTDLIVASGELIVDQNSTVNSITINPGARLTLNDGVTLATTNAFAIQSNETGNGTFVDKNAEGGLTNGRISTVQQYVTGSNNAGTPNGRFWYLTSPIKGATKATSVAFTASGANKLWSYAEAGGATLSNVYTEITDDATALTPGNGYVVRLTDPMTASFTGSAIATGTTSIPFTYTPGTGKPGFNLVGNPYPSYLNIASALASATDLETSIWCRSYNSTTSTMVFDTYNATSKIPVINSGRADLTDFVPPMQAIWVKAKSTSGNMVLTNAMRSHQTAGNLMRSADIQKIIRLKVSNGMNTDQTVISFNPEASDAFDNFDSRKMFNGIDSLPEIYTMAGTLSVAINGMAPFEGNKELALGFKTAKAGTFTITAAAFTNLDEGQTVILKDKLLNVSQNLNISPEYSFTSVATTTTDRFSVVISKTATGLDASQYSNFNVRGMKGGHIEINLTGSKSTIVDVYDMVGKRVHSENLETQTSMLNKTFDCGLYLVKINGVTRKVIIND